MSIEFSLEFSEEFEGYDEEEGPETCQEEDKRGADVKRGEEETGVYCIPVEQHLSSLVKWD